MTPHWMLFPIVVPLLCAMTCALLGPDTRRAKRCIGVVGLVGSLAAALYMFWAAHAGDIFVYRFGDLPIPYGIIFVLDRLGATMVLLNHTLGLFAYLYGIRGADREGRYFHFLFLMMIAGVDGAFLTADLFNLFVFFEILLLSACVLVVYGGGPDRAKAGLKYVFLNLLGSAIFLVAVGGIYGVAGTLNMAHLSQIIGEVGARDATILRASSYLLLTAFAVKGAIFPLYFWLPEAYASASAPVAAAFAIMTKVGAYTILRSTTLLFGEGGGVVENLAGPYLLPLGLVTMVVGTVSALAARGLRRMAAYLLIASVGTILSGFGLYNRAGISGSLFYLIHSTLVMGALFLLADLVARQRGSAHGDELRRGPRVREPRLLGMLFLVTMIAVVGLPPLTGFLGKVIILEAAIDTAWTAELWIVVGVTSFFFLVAVGRAGTTLFWKTDDPLEGEFTSARLGALPIAGLLTCIVAMVLFAGPVVEFTDAIAAQLLDPSIYVDTVMRESAEVSP